MEDYVNQAQQVMSRIAKDGLTTSQLRLFLSAVNAVNGKVEQYKNRTEGADPTKLSPELAMQVKFLKVKLAYQIGRAESKRGNPIKDFEREAQLMRRIDAIGDDIRKYEDFASYMEALVAFHKFYGGKD